MSKEREYSDMIRKYGTVEVSGGKLTGKTDTDYFYFLCPRCDGGGSERMRVIRYGQLPDGQFKYQDLRPLAPYSFNFSFELYCEKCKLHTVVKFMNEGIQGGPIARQA
jgi:hypothetical protein